MNLKAPITVSEFWHYSSQFYSQNDNQTALLWLQDNAGLNVNCVLLLLYLKTKNVFISLNVFKYLIKKNEKLDSLTLNLREKRRALKVLNIAKGMSDIRTFEYQSLLHQELDLEKQQQVNLIGEIIAITKQANNGDMGKLTVNLDIKYYLETLTTNIDDTTHFSMNSYIDILMNEQDKFSLTFGKM